MYELQWVKHSSSAALSFTGGRRLAAIAGQQGFVVWHTATGDLVFDGRAVGDPDHPVYGIDNVAVSADGTFAVAGDPGEQTVDVWDLRTGRRIRTLHGHLAWVNTVRADGSFSTVVTGDFQGNVRVWGLDWDFGE
ncbi:hypothetical protein DRA43_04725 [Micromonospora provocatoris]|nr:hypothetical protein DRA43_04725 [Micromonospora provocatoris]